MTVSLSRKNYPFKGFGNFPVSRHFPCSRDFAVYPVSRHFWHRLENWNVGSLEGWKLGRLEGWNVRRLEGKKVRRLGLLMIMLIMVMVMMVVHLPTAGSIHQRNATKAVSVTK